MVDGKYDYSTSPIARYSELTVRGTVSTGILVGTDVRYRSQPQGGVGWRPYTGLDESGIETGNPQVPPARHTAPNLRQTPCSMPRRCRFLGWFESGNGGTLLPIPVDTRTCVPRIGMTACAREAAVPQMTKAQQPTNQKQPHTSSYGC
jgi:hypothetical protein